MGKVINTLSFLTKNVIFLQSKFKVSRHMYYKTIMNMERLDIVQLIENHPLEKLQNHYQTELLERIRTTFDDNDQQLFVASFYCYLHHDYKTDFIINMDDIWKWLGFSRKDPCKRLIEKHFIKDVDYKILLHNLVEQVHGGHNKETILMNIETFKSLCLLANTERSKTVRKYYYKLEQLLHGLLEEQANELKIRLEENVKQLQEKEEQLKLKENDLEAQKLLVKKKDKELKQMAKKISLDWLYVAVTDNVQGVSKIGITEEILKRIDGHLSSNPGFKYVFTYQSKNNKLIEKCIKAMLDPFITNKNEWFNIESCDLIYLVEFFIELFDKNNGSEDPRLIIDFIKNISKKELSQEFIPNELYDDFFEQNIEIDEDKNYKCTLISIQKEFEKYLNEKGFNKQIRANVKYLDVYTLDIKRYVKYKFNKTCERINIDDAKSNIHIGSTFGFCGFRMKKLYVDKYFDYNIYKNFVDQYIFVCPDKINTIALSQILTVFDNYLKRNHIDDKMIKQNKYFKTSFREEILKEIETFTGLKAIKRTNSGKKNGYWFFTGIELNAG